MDRIRGYGQTTNMIQVEGPVGSFCTPTIHLNHLLANLLLLITVALHAFRKKTKNISTQLGLGDKTLLGHPSSAESPS